MSESKNINNKNNSLNLINNVLLKKYIECQAIQDVIDNIEQHVENKPIKRNWENELAVLSDWKEFKGTEVELIERSGLPKIAEVEIEKWYQNKFEEVKNLKVNELKDIYRETINEVINNDNLQKQEKNSSNDKGR